MEKKKKVKDLKEPQDEKSTNMDDDDDVTFLGNYHSSKVVKKVKLSLQKKESGKRAGQTLLTPDINLNDTADFRDDNMEKYKSKFSKTSTAPEDKSDRKARSKITSKSNKHAKPADIKVKSATVSRALSDSGSETTGSKYNEGSQDENLKIGEDSSNKKHRTDGKSELDVVGMKSKIKKSGATTKVSPLVRHCPTCNCDMENEVFKAHVRNCIDKFMYTMKEKRKKAQEALVAKEQGREKTQEAEVMEEEVEEIVDCNYQCQICQQDLSDLNSVRRGLHVNRCIDQMENQGKSKKDEPRPTVVLDCPMCGKPLKTEAARRAHLKKCARALGVTAEQMMHVIKTQEKENQQKSPTVAGPQLKKTKTNESTKQSRRKVKCPQDEATQLAMALSSSMADEERRREQALTGQLNLRGIPETTGQSGTKDVKKSRKKKNVEVASKPLLLQLSKAEAHNRITEKVTQIIVPQQVNVEEIRSTPPPQESRLSDIPGTKLFSYREGLTKSTDMLWQKTALFKCDEARYNKALYYCKALMPPVAMSCIVVGSKLRRLSEIPGRRKSGERRGSEREASQADNVSGSTPPASQSTQAASQSSPVVASTQTAVLLAELAADEDVLEVGGNGVDVVDTESGTVVGEVDDEPGKLSMVEEQEEEDDVIQEASGFCPEELIQIQDEARTECLSTLQRDYSAMLDDSLYSDIIIATRNKCTVRAHRVILATRCPALLKLNIDGVITLPEVSREAVMSLLQYVYAGEVCLRPSYLQDIKDMADRFSMEELGMLCVAAEKSQHNPVQEDVQDQPLDVEFAESERRKSIDHLFQEIMSDDFNPRCEDNVNDRNDSDDNSDEDDWREIYCSQRQQLQRQKSLEMDAVAGGKQGGTGGEDGVERGDSSSDCEFVQLPCEEVELGVHKKQPKSDQDELEGSFVFDKRESKDSSDSAKDDVFMQKETTGFNPGGAEKVQKIVNKVPGHKDKIVTVTKQADTKRGIKHQDSDNCEKSGKACVGKQAVQSGTKMDKYSHGSDRKNESGKRTVNSGSGNEKNSSSKRDSVRRQNISGKKSRKSSSESDVVSNNLDTDSLKSSGTSDSVSRRKDSVKESVTRLDEGTCGEDELFSDEELELALSSMETSDHRTDVHSHPQASKNGNKSGKRHDSGVKSEASHGTKEKKNNRTPTPDTDKFQIIKSGTSSSEEDVCPADDVCESNGELLPPSPAVKSQAKPGESAKSSNKTGEALSKEHVNKTGEVAKRKRPSSDKDASESPVFHKSISRSQQKHETPEATSSRKRVKLSTPHQNSDAEISRDHERNKMSTPLDRSYSNRSRSVVEQDSLYITPIPKDRQRSTFLLNTPAIDTQHSNPSGDSGAEYVATPVGKIVRNESGEEIIVGLTEAEKNSCMGAGIVGPISSTELQKLSRKSDSSVSDIGSIADGDDDRMSPIIQNTDVSHLSESVSKSISALPVGGSSDVKDGGNSQVESKDSDSDIEITGDNLLSLSQMSASPKFKSMFSLKKVASTKKCGSSQDLSLRISSPSSSSKRESGGSAELSGRETSEFKEHQAEGGVQDSPRCVADVWEGFDDMDAGCHLEPFCDADTEESPQKNNKSLHGSSQKKRYSHKRCVSFDGASKSRSEASPSTPHRHSSGQRNNQPEDEDDTLPSPEGVNSGNVSVEFEVPGGDSFLWNDDNAPEDSNTNAECEQGRQPSQTDKFKTPVSCRSKKPMKKWVPPSPFTPIPDYDAMNTPQLKKEVSKFGVRPVGKKRMKILLKDIYKQTHQYETDSDYEPENDLSQGPAPDPKSALFGTGPGAQSTGNQGFKKPAKSDVPAAASRKAGAVTSTSDTSEDGGSRSVTSSQESGCSDVPEESFLMDEDDISASQQGTQTDLHTKLMQFLHRRQDIHVRMLMYEPVELDWLKKEIQEAGIKCSMQKLMDFLDEKCLTFTMKKMTKRNPNRRQPRKKKKVKVPSSAI